MNWSRATVIAIAVITAAACTDGEPATLAVDNLNSPLWTFTAPVTGTEDQGLAQGPLVLEDGCLFVEPETAHGTHAPKVTFAWNSNAAGWNDTDHSLHFLTPTADPELIVFRPGDRVVVGGPSIEGGGFPEWVNEPPGCPLPIGIAQQLTPLGSPPG